jgi:hypothetical protein
MTDIDEQSRRLAPPAPELVLLPRDPGVGCVYWQWPGKSGVGELVVFVDDGSQDGREIARFEVDWEHGDQFFEFAGPDRVHHALLRWDGQELKSSRVVSPRRESGDEQPSFVRVTVGDQGLEIEPTEHEHPVHGRFPASFRSAPSSSSFSRK